MKVRHREGLCYTNNVQSNPVITTSVYATPRL